uniref:Uncharacterized protein n=1 Tax=Neolamprologus brichardi TaxID=32507 RepID=A0A3Q4GRR4_NEOBR
MLAFLKEPLCKRVSLLKALISSCVPTGFFHIESIHFVSCLFGPVQLYHTAVTLTQDEIRAALSHTDVEQMWQRDLRPLLVTRYPGSAGSQAVICPVPSAKSFHRVRE